MERIRWADGLRGIASVIVAFNHYFNGEIQTPFRSFWDEPIEENRYIFQLFPIRIIFAVYGMVPLLMVTAGFTTATAYFRVRDSNNAESSLRYLQGAITRKFFRLYLSLLTLAVISQFAYYFDLYHWDFPDEVLRGIRPWASPADHIQYLLRYLADAMNIVIFQWNESFNGQFWTLPFEFRGACVVSLLAMVLSGWQTKLRLKYLCLILLYLLWYGHWDLFSFVGGLCIAESRAASQVPQQATVSQVDKCKCPSPNFINSVLLLAGLYLICVDGGDRIAVEYRGLIHLQSPHWEKYGPWVDARFCWQSIGATMAVFAISRHQRFQSVLECSMLQYLGKISPSLYLIHELIYRLWRNPLRDFIWKLVTGTEYLGSHVAYLQPVAHLKAWIGSGVILGIVTILGARAYHSCVDERCVWLAYFVDNWVHLEPRNMIRYRKSALNSRRCNALMAPRRIPNLDGL